jgi:antibiotic biosynthesis monooxygenase (ABM) superfamily enzyme
MSDSIVQDAFAFADPSTGVITMLNRFTTKPGMLDDFIAAQTAEYRRLKGLVPGWIGNRLLYALDGSHVVNVAEFDGHANYMAWRDSALFAEHLEIIRPFMLKAEPALYKMIYDSADADA